MRFECKYLFGFGNFSIQNHRRTVDLISRNDGVEFRWARGSKKYQKGRNEEDKSKKIRGRQQLLLPENEVDDPPPSKPPIPNPSIPRAGLLPSGIERFSPYPPTFGTSSDCCRVNDKMPADEEETVGEVEGSPFGKLPDHLLIEIFIRLPVSQWVHISCASKQWATLFRRDCLWQAALLRSYPSSSLSKRWPGPIPRGLCRRRYMALYISRNFFSLQGDMDEIIGHAYLFLKEQLELSSMTPPSGIIHGTMIDQFIACGNSRDMAHELASQIWIVVLDNLEENEQTFLLLKRLAQEPDVFLPYPYSRSVKVQWRVFEKLFTDFRDCLNCMDYYDVMALAKSKFQPIPSTWLGH